MSHSGHQWCRSACGQSNAMGQVQLIVVNARVTGRREVIGVAVVKRWQEADVVLVAGRCLKAIGDEEGR